jgi:hypothetical protein
MSYWNKIKSSGVILRCERLRASKDAWHELKNFSSPFETPPAAAPQGDEKKLRRVGKAKRAHHTET